MGEPTFQFWGCPFLGSENVVILTDQALILDSVATKEVTTLHSQLQLGAIPWDRLLSLKAVIIPLVHVHEVFKDNNTAKLVVFHGEDKLPYHKEVFVETPAVRDEILTALHQRMGPEWELDDRNHSMWGTLVLLLVVLIITTMAGFFGVRQIEAGNAPAPVNARGELGKGFFEILSGSIGSIGVLIGGTVLCLLTVWSIVHTRKHPPKAPGVTLKRIGVPKRY